MLRTFSIASLLLAISACTTLGPDFETPQAELDDSWVTEGATVSPQASNTEEIEQWWSVFNDPVLDRLIEQGYLQNLPLQVSGLRIFEARAQLGIAVGQQYPQQQQAFGDLARIGLSENAPNFNKAVDDSYNQATIGLEAAWELDFWGRFRRGVESADANLGASIADYDNALVSLTAEIATAYLTMRTVEERLAIARQNVETQQGSFRIADVRYRNGAVSELDPAQAKYLLRSTESTVPDLQGQLRQTRNAISILLGLTPGQLGSMLDGEEGLIPKPPETLNLGVPADLLRRRPDIRQAELQAAAQSALVGVAETDLYPRLALLGSVSLLTGDTGNNSLGDLFESDSLAYNYGPQASWAILNYGRIKNQVRVQDARLEELLVNYRNTVLQAAREVEDGIASFVGARDRTAFLKQAVAAAQRAVDLALIQYREGAVDYQRVLDTQRALLDLQDQHTSSRGDVVRSLVATYRALGGGWKIRAGNDFVPQDVQQRMGQRTDWGRLLDDRKASDELPAAPPTGRQQPLFNRPDW
jgi:NodT family efflux transporter outer membrane factor (OMF) lipoprotein